MNRSFFAFALSSLLAGCGSSVSGGGGGDGGGGTITTTGTPTDTTKACVVGGCSGQLCVEEDFNGGSTCEWLDVYACYQELGICERDAAGDCGFRDTPELQACVSAGGRLPASGGCVRNAGDACASDLDCENGGCGGELCFNPAVSSGVSTCDCTTPDGPTCGCVNGTCLWWQAP